MFSTITVTYPDESSAKNASETLINMKLVACTNLFPIESIYWWKGKVEREKEWMAEYKTRQELFDSVMKEIKRIHPYENPCIIEHSITNGSQDYLDWIMESTARHPED